MKISPFWNWTEDLIKHFTKDVMMANKQMKRCLISFVMREIQVKATERPR